MYAVKLALCILHLHSKYCQAFPIEAAKGGTGQKIKILYLQIKILNSNRIRKRILLIYYYTFLLQM